MASSGNQSAPPNYEEVIRKIWEAVQHKKKLNEFRVTPLDEASATDDPFRCENNDLVLQESCMEGLFLFVYPKLLQRTLDVEDQKAFLTTALLLNSCVRTFWNMRRELVLQKELNVDTELRFINLGLTHWTCCDNAINYRKWLLKDEITNKPFDFVIGEISLIEDICDDYDKEDCCSLWNYCIWLLGQCDSRPDFADFIHDAWQMSGQYMCVHPHDASHLSYRERIISRIIRNRDRLKSKFLKLAKDTAAKEGIKGLKADDAYIVGMMLHEFELNASLMTFGLFGANFEGLWSYRRFLVWCWTVEIQEFVSRHGELRLQHAGGCVSDRFDTFEMYLHKRIQKKFLSKVKGPKAAIDKFKDWIETFCPPGTDWEDMDDCSIA